jgi:hypothetical protein
VRGARGLRQVHRGGGPRRVHLRSIERPEGLIFTGSRAVLEVETAGGETVPLEVGLPVPFFYAWGYRIARELGLPIASTLEPEDVSLSFGVPDWAWPGSRPDATPAERA